MTDVRSEPPRVLPDLAHDSRLSASAQRLLRDDYGVASVLHETAESAWPGDLVGRLLLSLSRLARIGVPTGERADALGTALIAELEPRGYLGPGLAEPVDEQQVAGHGWVVAGLLQYAAIGGGDRARDAANRVVDALILPALARFDEYPVERQELGDQGSASGTTFSVEGVWRVSTDVWCVLLTLNALVPAAMETGRTDLDTVIQRLAQALEVLDLPANHVQLHAALAAARNLADYGHLRGDRSLVAVARGVYDAYAKQARTLNYATFNWFGRPDSWTEPCAMVDSLGLAQTLAEVFDDDGYREDARRIARSGLDISQRLDGSFGLDTVTTPAQPVLEIVEYDARWCCTMRGAIGLVEARERSVRIDAAQRSVVLDDGYPCVADLGGARLTVRPTSEPTPTAVRMTISGTAPGDPPWTVRIAGGAEAVILGDDGTGNGDHEVRLGIPRQLEHREVGDDAVIEFAGAVILVDDPELSARLRPITEIAGTYGPGEAPRLHLARRGAR